MREIRFRYTYKRKEDGKIYQVVYPIEAIEEGQTHVMRDNPLWTLIARDQYIGLRDRNGTDIYEADLLAVFDRDHDKPVLPVVFEDGAFGYRLTEMHGLFVSFAGNSHNLCIKDGTSPVIEKVGNVYESPSLLSETQLQEYLKTNTIQTEGE